MKYAVLYEKTATGYSAHVPDLPGCIAAGFSLEETAELMKGAIEMHVCAIRVDGDLVPEPTTVAGEVEVVGTGMDDTTRHRGARDVMKRDEWCWIVPRALWGWQGANGAGPVRVSAYATGPAPGPAKHRFAPRRRSRWSSMV